jgi:tetratricopeptide (TPR) repeat protein
VAEALGLPELLSQALATKGALLQFRGRLNESQALTAHALAIALEHDLTSAALRAHGNLAFALSSRDRLEEAIEQLEQGLALARKVGNRFWELSLVDSMVDVLVILGRWDEAASWAALMPEPQPDTPAPMTSVTSLAEIYAHRGELGRAEEVLARGTSFATSADLQDRAAYLASRAVLYQEQGRHAEALEAAGQALRDSEQLGPDAQGVKVGLVAAAEAALALGDLVEELLAVVDRLRPGERPPYVDAQAARLRARLTAARGQPDRAEAGFKAAAGLLRELGMPFWLGVTLLEHGELLAAGDRPGEAASLLEEAAAIFERLGARPWSERVRRRVANSRPVDRPTAAPPPASDPPPEAITPTLARGPTRRREPRWLTSRGRSGADSSGRWWPWSSPPPP